MFDPHRILRRIPGFEDYRTSERTRPFVSGLRGDQPLSPVDHDRGQQKEKSGQEKPAIRHGQECDSHQGKRQNRQTDGDDLRHHVNFRLDNRGAGDYSLRKTERNPLPLNLFIYGRRRYGRRRYILGIEPRRSMGL